jgi:hypothetical protein
LIAIHDVGRKKNILSHFFAAVVVVAATPIIYSFTSRFNHSLMCLSLYAAAAVAVLGAISMKI